MANFRFDKLLKLRETERNEAKNAFLDAQSLRHDAERRLAEIDAQLEAERADTRRAREVGAIGALELQHRQRFRERLLAERAEAHSRLDALAQDAESKRAKLNDAIKEVKILENLKDKTLERELEDAKRRDEKASDDLANQLESVERQRLAKEG